MVFLNQSDVSALIPLPFPPHTNHLPINQQNPFAIAGPSHNIDGPSLTPGTSVVNIYAQLANGPQLASSYRLNAAVLQPPVAMGREVVAALFAQAAQVSTLPSPNNRRVQGENAAAHPLPQAPSQNPQIIPAPPVDHILIPMIIPVPMDEDELPFPHIPEPVEPVPPPPRLLAPPCLIEHRNKSGEGTAQ
ncbi:hypothetical protein BU17DRAFT_94891 [Hysterangium stoloniferum]|nr:hypothetical protein BU17DRAFT_94891 [Hysterangium stoloniferum]